MNKLFKTFLFIVAAVSFAACGDVDLEPNLNEPDGSLFVNEPEQGADNPELANVIAGASETFFNHVNGFYGIYPDLMCDQSTSTNRFASFWDYNMHPRQRLNNRTTNPDIDNISATWDDMYTVINNCNTILEAIEGFDNTVTLGGQDKTAQILASAHFVKGVALGYLGIVYDQAFFTNYDIDPGTLEFKRYDEITLLALDELDMAISIASAAGNFDYEYFPGTPSISKTTFLELANSYAARFLISWPRTRAEADGNDHSRIMAYANNGLTSDFEPSSVEDVFFSNYQDWRLFTLSDGAGYLPSDIKIMNLADPNYPKLYPLDPAIVLPQAVSADPRLDMYYGYTPNFGFLRADRDRTAFTNYFHTRYYNNNNENDTGLPVQVFMKNEIDLIKAETMLRMGNPAGAATILDAGPRGTVGGITTAATAAGVEDALFYEWSLEMDMATGMWTIFNFHRRFDLLQKGTPLHYPVPATELEITGLPFYNHGGFAFGEDEGTADGGNSWLN